MKNKMQHVVPGVLAIVLSLVLSADAGAQSVTAEAEPQPLFSSHDTLFARIHAPLTTLMREQPEDEYLNGLFTFIDSDGDEHTLALKLQTRGRYRRRKSICDFSPIRLNFRKDELEGTLFAGQDKLKLVTHCESRRDNYEQMLLREYLAYRILQTMTHKSFGARLMRITYIDIEDDDEPMTKYGFVIEDEDKLGERLGLVQFEERGISEEDLDGRQANLISVFEYLIGNTDFSLILGPEDSSCCHNSVLYSEGGPPYTPIPYDFDFSGLVDAPYAEPNPRFRIRSVKTRLYRGRCIYNGMLDGTFAHFLEKEAQIRDLVSELDGLDDRDRREVERYLDDFFEDISDPNFRERNFVNKCI